MKKIMIAFVLATVMACMSVHLVFADAAITYTVDYDATNDSFFVSGAVDDEKGNIPLLLVVSENADGEFVAAYQTIAVECKDGVEFAFDEVKLPFDAVTGEYKFVVSGEGYSVTETEVKKYLSLADKRVFISEVNGLITEGGDGLYGKVLERAAEFGISVTALKDLDSDAQAVFDDFMPTVQYIIPDADFEEDAEKTEMLFDACKSFKEDVDKAMVFASLSNVKNQATLDSWITKYFETLNMHEDDTETPYDESKIYAYLDDVQKSETFVNRISDYNIPSDMAGLKNYIYESVLLSAVEVLPSGNTYTIIKEFPSLIVVNKSKLAKLSTDAQGQIYVNVAKKYYKTLEDLAEAFDDEVIDNLGESKDKGSSGSGGGSGWGGGTGGSNLVTVNNGVTQPLKPEPDKSFADISGVPWATDAILYLADKGVINGKTADLFAPDDFITRAEFVKILTLALGNEIDVTEKSSFVDVVEGSWYTPYVAMAEKQKLVLGNEKNMFMPDAGITRQDMAVILHRAFKPEIKNKSLVFDDEDLISGYAVKAVEALTAAGVINGTGNNMFSPIDGATRAQAAVMIYNLIK